MGRREWRVLSSRRGRSTPTPALPLGRGGRKSPHDSVQPRRDLADALLRLILRSAEFGAADVSVTADIPLAARCLKAGAKVIGPTGKPYTEANIGAALAMRDLDPTLVDASGPVTGTRPWSLTPISRWEGPLSPAHHPAAPPDK